MANQEVKNSNESSLTRKAGRMTREEAIRILKNLSLCGAYHQLIHVNDTDSEAISMAIKALEQPESFADADKLKRCRFEYINACKIVARPTPDTSKGDIYDAYAVIKALHPIFDDEEF